MEPQGLWAGCVWAPQVRLVMAIRATGHWQLSLCRWSQAPYILKRGAEEKMAAWSGREGVVTGCSISCPIVGHWWGKWLPHLTGGGGRPWCWPAQVSPAHPQAGCRAGRGNSHLLPRWRHLAVVCGPVRPSGHRDKESSPWPGSGGQPSTRINCMWPSHQRCQAWEDFLHCSGWVVMPINIQILRLYKLFHGISGEQLQSKSPEGKEISEIKSK